MSNEQNPDQDRPEEISDEIARKYDPERLLRMIAKRAGRGESLDHSVRQKYEKRFGVDLGHVRIYTGEFAEEFNRRRDAYAVTVGSTGMILMGGSPEKSMGSSSGQALLAHELTHVAQQSRHAGGGLHRKATQDLPFTEEHEAEAEAVEAEEGQGAARAAADAGTAKLKAQEDHEAKLEEIRNRVLEMAADAARTQMTRNGIQRRP
ncbi:MAG TPA: DUF4157 domain-containing protein [Kofleriaceae bacterium]|nr:DUF4157 domain-containing protein [Kofleriaceae bacterium]